VGFYASAVDPRPVARIATEITFSDLTAATVACAQYQYFLHLDVKMGDQ